MKKFSILTVSLLLAASSVFAWSKRSESTGNLGRMYVAIQGGGNFTKAKNTAGESSSPTGASTSFIINAPIFKPSVNVFKDISWAGIDGQLFFDYDYTGEYSFGSTTAFKKYDYGFGAALVPYLNFETGFDYFKAIKPYAKGFVAYKWSDVCYSVGGTTNHYNDFAYGFEGGVEFVITDSVSFAPFFGWSASAQKDTPCTREAGVDLSFWFNDQLGFSLFWVHDFGSKYAGYEIKHGDVIGAKIKIGFMR